MAREAVVSLILGKQPSAVYKGLPCFASFLCVPLTSIANRLVLAYSTTKDNKGDDPFKHC